MESNCAKCFTPSEITVCYINKAYKYALRTVGSYATEWDSTAVLIRDKAGPRVLFTNYTKFYDLEYDEFLRIPFIEDVVMRKLLSQVDCRDFVGIHFRALIANQLQIMGRKKRELLFENGVLIIKHYWVSSKLTEKKFDELSVRYIYQIDCSDLPDLVEGVRYSEPMIIRTKYSKQDTKNY